MSGVIPIEPGDPEQRLEIALGGATYVLRVRWNTRDNEGRGAWYLDIWESDGKTPVALGLKIVLGVLLGRRSTHPLFAGGLFAVPEPDVTSEPGLYDLGGRVTLWYLEPDDLRLAALPAPETPPAPP